MDGRAGEGKERKYGKQKELTSETRKKKGGSGNA